MAAVATSTASVPVSASAPVSMRGEDVGGVIRRSFPNDEFVGVVGGAGVGEAVGVVCQSGCSNEDVVGGVSR